MTVSLKLLSSIGSSPEVISSLRRAVSSGNRPGSRHAKESPDDVNEENMVLSGLPANCSNGRGRAIGGRRHTKEAKPAA
jgi:hypothetical protein